MSNIQKFSSTLENDYLNEAQASRYVKMSVYALRSRNAKGDVESTKINHLRFYRKSDLDKFLSKFGAQIRLRQARIAASQGGHNAASDASSAGGQEKK